MRDPLNCSPSASSATRSPLIIRGGTALIALLRTSPRQSRGDGIKPLTNALRGAHEPRPRDKRLRRGRTDTTRSAEGMISEQRMRKLERVKRARHKKMSWRGAPKSSPSTPSRDKRLQLPTLIMSAFYERIASSGLAFEELRVFKVGLPHSICVDTRLYQQPGINVT